MTKLDTNPNTEPNPSTDLYTNTDPNTNTNSNSNTHPPIQAARVFDDRSKEAFLESSVLQEDKRNVDYTKLDVDMDEEEDDELIG
jgi:hypothetical protein